MPTTESGKKTCIVCGADVAGKPRVKDAQGRYMCAGDCQAKYAAQVKAQPAPTPPPAAKGPSRPAAPPVVSVADDKSILNSLIDQSPMLKARTCEKCGSVMPQDGVICTRCGFNHSTGKNIKTAVIVEKEKKEKAPKAMARSRYASSSDFGPSFGVLFLLVFGGVAGLAALGFVHPLFVAVALFVGSIVNLVGSIWGLVKAFQNGETIWGVIGICSYIVPFVGLAWLYYMLLPNEDKWSKALFAGSFVGILVGVAILVGVIGVEAFQQGAGISPP